MAIIINQTNYEQIPPGEYPARIISLERADGNFKPQIKFEFEIQGGDYAGQTVRDWATATFSSLSKLYAWTQAALDRNIPSDYKFNSDDVVGRMVMIDVIIRPNDDGMKFNRVKGVRPYRPIQNGGSQKPPPSTNDDSPF